MTKRCVICLVFMICSTTLALILLYQFPLISPNIDAPDLPIFKGHLFQTEAHPMIDGGGQGQMLLHIPC